MHFEGEARIKIRTLPVVLGALLIARLPAGAENGGGEAAPVAQRIPAPRAESIEIHPARVILKGAGAVEQVLVSAKVPHPRRPGEISLVDVTRDASYASSDAAVVHVTAEGQLRSRGDGSALVHVAAAGKEATLEVVVLDSGSHLPMNFANEIVPIFTKYGCNAGACHGKNEGRNGFRLSLLGFEPELDHDAIVKQSRGRRASLDVPEESLILLKPSGKVVHEGGHLFDPAGDDHAKILRWIRSGMPFGAASDPKVASVDVEPPERVIERGGRQQVKVTARYSDGRSEDVTRLAQYESGDAEMAEVTAGGLVTVTSDLSGEAAIMIRYQGKVNVFRATVPHGAAPDSPAWMTWESRNFIDDLVLAKLRKLELPPSDLAADGEFIRRASLDICGTLPSPDEVRRFLADPSPGKREDLVDSLLERPEYASYFALKWGDLLRIRRDDKQERMRGTYAFHQWIRESLARNVPYDRIVAELLTASGEIRRNPPVTWYREAASPEVLADEVAQVFLGTKIQCAQCHHHPFERWSQRDYYGMVSFFARLSRKTLPGFEDEPVLFVKADGFAKHPKTGEAVPPHPLGGEELRPARGEDPRERLAAWMTDPANGYFSRALANRMWAHFFGRGITEPVDDLRATNPPSNPELLDALAKHFTEEGFDLKRLIRTICASRTYQLACRPNEANARDRSNFSRCQPRRLQAEVLLDALSKVTGKPEAFSGLPQGTRAIDLPDESTSSGFLMMFGKPRRVSSCDCERPREASLGQSLHLLNSDEVLGKIQAKDGLAARLAAEARDDAEKVKELYLLAFAREPGEVELRVALDHLRSPARERAQGFEDILWTLINTKEFQFNH